MKTSLGIWALGPMVTRFVPGGYQPERAGETTAERVRRAVDGLGDLIDGYEFHYPQELDEDNVDEIREALGPDHDIYCLAGGLHLDPRFGRIRVVRTFANWGTHAGRPPARTVLIGQDTRSVLTERGYPAARIDELVAANTVTEAEVP